MRSSKNYLSVVAAFFCCMHAQYLFANTQQSLATLKRAYPEFIKETSDNSITWQDDSVTSIDAAPFHGIHIRGKDSPSLQEQLSQAEYPAQCENLHPQTDSGRTRNEAFFARMYGDDAQDVRKNLVTVYWMPAYFGRKFPLRITRINHIDEKLMQVSAQLETLAEKNPELLKYLDHPSGAFYWRHIQQTNRRSPHSFGIAIDLNVRYSNYWLWDTNSNTNQLSQDDTVVYQNKIPCDIVRVFEKNGFIWGGKWRHYDSMHFEYRPELLPG